MGISREEVLWCYRNLLGREPESDATVRSHLDSTSFRALVKAFVRSPEFMGKQARVGQPSINQGFFHALDLQKNEVDVVASSEQLAACIAKIKAAWSHLGEVRPHFSVLTDDQFLPENLGGSIDKIWESGEEEAATAQRILDHHGFSDSSGKTCVEYGCGVGRVTMGFARRFARVHGYDISPGHLRHARERALELHVRNVTFHQCAGSVPEDLQSCDFFYSRIVFQHNPPPLAAELIKAALRSLRPDGIAIFQIPTYRIGYRFKLAEWLAAEQPLDMEMHCLPQQHVFELIAGERCLPLEVREDNSTGAPERFISNTFVVRKPG